MYSLLIRPITRRIKDSKKASAFALGYFKFEGMIPGGRFFISKKIVGSDFTVSPTQIKNLSFSILHAVSSILIYLNYLKNNDL